MHRFHLYSVLLAAFLGGLLAFLTGRPEASSLLAQSPWPPAPPDEYCDCVLDTVTSTTTWNTTVTCRLGSFGTGGISITTPVCTQNQSLSACILSATVTIAWCNQAPFAQEARIMEHIGHNPDPPHDYFVLQGAWPPSDDMEVYNVTSDPGCTTQWPHPRVAAVVEVYQPPWPGPGGVGNYMMEERMAFDCVKF